LKELASNSKLSVNSQTKDAETRRPNAALLALEDWSDVDTVSVGHRSVDLDVAMMTGSLAHISTTVQITL